ncbi:MAG: c-type cytochrome, partial [Deltaproteobacteria bacterium]|nr:c-type cytochrome [Deltaproteobacteria bacterium]
MSTASDATNTAPAAVSPALRGLFVAGCLAFLASVVAWLVDEVRPEWSRHYLDVQERLALAEPGDGSQRGGEERGVPTLVPQIYLRELGVVDRCTACHAGVGDSALAGEEQPLASHPGPMLDLHDVSKLGCTYCHDGQGRATRTLDAHGDVQHWNAPLLRGRLVQASCSRCHDRTTVARAPDLRKGAEIMQRRACFGCHQMPGAPPFSQVGPDLSFSTSRTSPGWLFAWLKSPSNVLSSPRMADFLLTDEEAADIVAFLLTLRKARPVEVPRFPPESASDDTLDALYEKGASIYRVSRCISCHAVDGRGGTPGPDHARIAHKLNIPALLAWIEDPGRFHSGHLMPRFRFTVAERQALAFYLSEEMRDTDWEERLAELTARAETLLPAAAPERGRKRVLALGCVGCHKIDGMQQSQPVGADLTLFGEKPASRLMFPPEWTGPLTREAWTRAKLKDPRAGGDSLLMPKIELSDEDAEAVLVASLSYTKPAPQALWADSALVQPPHPYPAGKAGALMRELRCFTCHAFDGAGATLAPDLGAEGSRVGLKWLQEYLREPYEIRPLLVMRMPRFYLSREEVETLAGFLHFARVRDGLPRVLTL